MALTVDNVKGYTKAEIEDFHRVGQDIELFLRLANNRIEDRANDLPFKAVHGHQVISWLMALVEPYKNGEPL